MWKDKIFLSSGAMRKVRKSVFLSLPRELILRQELQCFRQVLWHGCPLLTRLSDGNLLGLPSAPAGSVQMIHVRESAQASESKTGLIPHRVQLVVPASGVAIALLATSIGRRGARERPIRRHIGADWSKRL